MVGIKLYKKISTLYEGTQKQLRDVMLHMTNMEIETITRVGEDYGLEITYVDGTIDKIFMGQ